MCFLFCSLYSLPFPSSLALDPGCFIFPLLALLTLLIPINFTPPLSFPHSNTLLPSLHYSYPHIPFTLYFPLSPLPRPSSSTSVLFPPPWCIIPFPISSHSIVNLFPHHLLPNQGSPPHSPSSSLSSLHFTNFPSPSHPIPLEHM